MNNQFDELTKSLAQLVTRRAALKKFGIGLAGMALACFGLANKAEAVDRFQKCVDKCLKNFWKVPPSFRRATACRRTGGRP